MDLKLTEKRTGITRLAQQSYKLKTVISHDKREYKYIS